MNVLGPIIILMQLDEITNLTPNHFLFTFINQISPPTVFDPYISNYQHNEIKTKSHSNKD